MIRIFAVFFIGAVCRQVSAFLPSRTSLDVAYQRRGLFDISIGSDMGSESEESIFKEKSTLTTRTAFMQDAIKASFAMSIASFAMNYPLPAFASGGATAGGAYLLSGDQCFAIRSSLHLDVYQYFMLCALCYLQLNRGIIR